MPITENFDGVTAPALPAGWTGTNAQTSTTQAQSGVNSVRQSALSAVMTLMNDTADVNSGNETVEAYAYFDGTSQFGAWVAARWTAKTFTGNGYFLYLQATTATPGLTIQKMTAGSNSAVSSNIGAASFGTNIWYRMRFTCNGSGTGNLTGQVQRLSDNLWLQPGGSWSASQVDCITATDASYTAAGYHGIGSYGTVGNCYIDTFSAASLSGTFTASPTSIDNSATTTVSLVGSGTAWNGTTTFTASGVSGASTGTVVVTDATHATVQVTTGAATGTLTLTEGVTGSASTTVSVILAPVRIFPDSANVFCSGAYIDGSHFAHLVDNGTYFKGTFSGSTTLSVNLDESTYIANSIAVGNYGQFLVSIDGGAFSIVTPTASGNLSLATGLSTGAHTYLIYFELPAEGDGWTPTWETILQSVQIDNGGSFSAPSSYVALRPKRAIVLGDSITAGYNTDLFPEGTYPPATFAQLLLMGLNAEGQQVGKSGQGWLHNATAFAAAFPATWASYTSGHARTLTGYDYLIACHGTNDAGDVTATVQSWIATARAAVGANCWIICSTPFTSNGRTAEIKAAVAAYKAANPTDVRVAAVDPSAVLLWVPSSSGAFKFDSVHPNTLGMVTAASVLIGLVQAATSSIFAVPHRVSRRGRS